MQRTHILAAASLAAFLSLGACNSEPEVISANGVDPQAEALKNAPPVELPPAIQASRTYRCDDNSLLYGVFYTNDTVKVSNKEGAEGTILTAENGEPPYVAEGYSVSADADEISYTAPGKGTQTCHV